MDNLIGPLFIVLRLQAMQLRAAFGDRRRRGSSDAGVSTLEMVIIALGLMGIAGLLIAALTVAVTNRTNKIK